MKLYATIESERAIKGQGGEYLNINIYNESKNLTYYINIDDGVLSLYENNPYTNFDGLLLYKTKLKSKTKKYCLCKDSNIDRDGFCEECGEKYNGAIDEFINTKGKSQKGECENANCNNIVAEKGMHYCEDHQN